MMLIYEPAMMSDLERMVYNEMLDMGFEPLNQDDINKFWAEKLDAN
jgi:hypothetical protein